MMKSPRAILGTMTFGGQTNYEEAANMIFEFCSSKWNHVTKEDPMLDTAISYNSGRTEQMLGNMLFTKEVHPRTHTRTTRNATTIATKANSFTSEWDKSPSGLGTQLETSLSSLQTCSVDLFYLHAPDIHRDIDPLLEEVQRLYKQDKFQSLGLSNFTAWETVYIHAYMSKRGYIVPSVYQGMYNVITRQVEQDLFPALQKCGNMKFYAFNPLSGGMLSGKYNYHETDDEIADANEKVGGRFAGKSVKAQRYRKRYQQKEQFDAIAYLKEALEDHPNHNDSSEILSLTDASFRWLCHHSQLDPETDGIIIGASNMTHFEANMKSMENPNPLPEDVLGAFNQAYQICQHVCPPYAPSYSGSALSSFK